MFSFLTIHRPLLRPSFHLYRFPLSVMNINLCHHHSCLHHYHHHHPHFPLPEMITRTNNDDIAVGSPEIDGGGYSTRFVPRGHWKPEEDAKLKELVALHGAHNWNFIAQNLQGRSGKSCRLRWYNQLDPKLNRSTFTEEEEERLVEAQKMYGNKWATIARLYFPGRTDNAVKNHWHVLLARNDRWWRQQQQINPVSNASFTSTCDGYKRMKHTNIINNAVAAAESTVDSKSNVVHVDETASTCTHLSLSAASFGRNPMPPDFQTPRTVTGSSSSRVEEGKGRQCYSPLPILSTLVAEIGLDITGSSSSRVEEGKGRQCYSPLPILSTPMAEIGSGITGSSSSRVEEEKSMRGVNVSGIEWWGGQSESSNSEVTAASESVANLKSTNQTTDKGNQLNEIAFFDFLGMGAT